AVNSAPPSRERIVTEIKKFSMEHNARVTQRVRNEADINSAVEKLLRIYDEIIAWHRKQPADVNSELRAYSNYLRRLVPLIKALDAEEKLGKHTTLGGAIEED